MQNNISSMVFTKFANICQISNTVRFELPHSFCAIYSLVIFAFETLLILTFKIKNMWEKQAHAY